MSLYVVRSLIVLDGEGKRIAVKYFDDQYPSVKEQLTFERNLFAKTSRAASGEIIMIENLISVYRNTADVWIYINGVPEDNELLLYSLLSGMHEAMYTLFKGSIDKRVLLENYDTLLLLIDEMVDRGVIFESDALVLVQRVTMKDALAEQPLAEQTASQTFSTIAEKLKSQFLKT